MKPLAHFALEGDAQGFNGLIEGEYGDTELLLDEGPVGVRHAVGTVDNGFRQVPDRILPAYPTVEGAEMGAIAHYHDRAEFLEAAKDLRKGLGGRNRDASKLPPRGDPGMGLEELPHLLSNAFGARDNGFAVAARLPHGRGEREALAMSVRKREKESCGFIIEIPRAAGCAAGLKPEAGEGPAGRAEPFRIRRHLVLADQREEGKILGS